MFFVQTFSGFADVNKAVICDLKALTKSVDDTSTEIQKMKAVYTQALRQKLRELKVSHDWTDEEYSRRVKVYLEGHKIETYQNKEKALLKSVSSLSKGKKNASPNCAMLSSLNQYLGEIVRNTKEKWDFIFHQIKTDIKKK